MNENILRWVLLADVLLLVPSYLVSLYVQQRILPEVEAQLSNCKIVMGFRSFWGAHGYVGKSQRYGVVYLALTSTRFLKRKGLVDIDEVSNVSAAHRRWICLPMRIGTLSMCVLFVLFLLDKFC